MIKYLGELYNYRMIESSLVFTTLYTLITLGITYDGINFVIKSLLIRISIFYHKYKY